MSTPHHDGATPNDNSTTTRDEGTPSKEILGTVPRMTMKDFFFGNMPDTPIEEEESNDAPIVATTNHDCNNNNNSQRLVSLLGASYSPWGVYCRRSYNASNEAKLRTTRVPK